MSQEILKIYLTDRFILFFSNNLNTKFHSHHAMQISLNLNGPVTVDCEDHLHTGDLVLINGNRKHAIKESGISMHILIDSELVEAEELRCTLNFKDCYTLSLKDALISRTAKSILESNLSKDQIFDFYHLIIDNLITNKHNHSHDIDDRIFDAINKVKLDSTKAYTPDQLSKEVFLSLSRFQHLFKEETGTTLSKFILWQRTLNAVKLINEGKSFTNAALEAGFSDGPHFSRMVKKSFGLTMSDMSNNKNMEVIIY